MDRPASSSMKIRQFRIAPELAFAPETSLPAAEAPAFAQAPEVAPSSTVYGPAMQPSFSLEVSPSPIAVPETPPYSSGSKYLLFNAHLLHNSSI